MQLQIEGVFYQHYLEKYSIDIVLKLTKTLTRVQRCCVQKIGQKLPAGLAAYSPHTYIHTDSHTYR